MLNNIKNLTPYNLKLLSNNRIYIYYPAQIRSSETENLKNLLYDYITVKHKPLLELTIPFSENKINIVIPELYHKYVYIEENKLITFATYDIEDPYFKYNKSGNELIISYILINGEKK